MIWCSENHFNQAEKKSCSSWDSNPCLFSSQPIIMQLLDAAWPRKPAKKIQLVIQPPGIKYESTNYMSSTLTTTLPYCTGPTGVTVYQSVHFQSSLTTTQAGDQVELEVTVWGAGEAGLGELLQAATKLRSSHFKQCR